MSRPTMWQCAVGFAMAVPALAPVSSTKAGERDRDQVVCYKASPPVIDTFRLVLDVKKHSDLSFRGGPRQTVYSALGKHSYQYNYKTFMAVTHGAVVTSEKDRWDPRRESGAHLGLISEFVRSGGPDAVLSPVNFDCTSTYVSSTPREWQCKTLYGGTVTPTTLTQIYPDKLCSDFQDGAEYTPPPHPYP